jgi:AraC-type transcriptional regulator N-terminus
MAEALLAAVRRYADSHVDADGIAATPISGLNVARATERSGLRYERARPLIAFVLQGSEHVTMGSRSFELGAGDSLLVAADVPTVSEITRASAGVPYYSLVLVLDLAVVEELLGAMEIAVNESEDQIRVERIESEVADAALRLVRLLERPSAVPILEAQFLREMHYWLMAGPHGPAIRNLAVRQSQ